MHVPLRIGLRLPGGHGGLGEGREDDGVVARVDGQSDALAGLATDERDRERVVKRRFSGPQH